jgi:hypothetical protein
MFVIKVNDGQGGYMALKTFEVELTYEDRQQGPNTSAGKIRVDASGLSVAVGKALRQIIKGVDRKVRFDMNKNGITIRVANLGDAVAEQKQAAANA